MRADFYQLGRSAVEQVLPKLLEKALSQGSRALVLANDPALLEILDRRLWEYDAASFLPHAREGFGDEDQQPILLSTRTSAANGASLVVLADGEWPDDIGEPDRVLLLFGSEGIERARAAWRSLSCDKRYWTQTERGGWTQSA